MTHVIERLPATISPIRCSGTPMSLANLYFDIAQRLKKISSSSISSGEIGVIVLVYVHSMKIDNINSLILLLRIRMPTGV